MKSWPPSEAMSWMVMMLGWFRAEAALASCTKRRDGHHAVQVGVAGLLDHAHPALAELAFNPIVAQRLADHRAAPSRSGV
jgi:hypothetical protein